MIADVSITYEALDAQQLIVLQEDLDQDGLLNQNMPVVYNPSEIVVTEGTFFSTNTFLNIFNTTLVIGIIRV